MTAPPLINGIYPVPYFSLNGVDEIQYPDSFWWSSRQRFAAVDSADGYLPITQGGTPTIEYLEIDLGRVREVNYINLDVIRAPITIGIEYSNSANDHAGWVAVIPVQNQPFNNQVFFDSNNRTLWYNADLHFTDFKGNIVHARYLRLSFQRRDEAWPVTTSTPFQWPVFVKHLRTARYISDGRDGVGPLLLQESLPALAHSTLPLTGTETREARQQFVYPADVQRGDVVPKITGFGVLLDPPDLTHPEVDQDASQVTVAWSIWNVAAPALPVLLLQGTETGLVPDGTEDSWLDVIFAESDFIDGDLDATYEFRIKSLTPALLDSVHTTSPNQLSSRAIPGTLTFTLGSTAVATSVDTRAVVKAGSWIIDVNFPNTVYLVNSVSASTITINIPFSGTTVSGVTGSVLYSYSEWSTDEGDYLETALKNLALRVYGDVADTGRDILGNVYRYASRRNAAADVLSPTAPGWMSSPAPTPDAVEALYFDVRGTNPDTQMMTLSTLNAIKIAPRTPGVRMNVYYSRQNVNGEVPTNTTEWDQLLWTPASHDSYTLRRHEVIELPQPVQASFMKLEFTALNPLPYNLPLFPPLPPKRYRRFPTWVETQFTNAVLRDTVNSWFLRNATPVQVQVLKTLADPVREFEYEQSQLLASLALGTLTDQQVVNSGIVDIDSKALIDPVTASKVYITDVGQFRNSLLVSVDQSSILGQVTAARTDPRLLRNPIERTYRTPLGNTLPVVSTTNSRISESYQNLARLPMRFNRTCRHDYTEEEAVFNKKAYFVGIQSVEFMRADYTVPRDDKLVRDDLFDDNMLLVNTWTRDFSTAIPDGATVYVSYNVGEETVADETVTLNGSSAQQLAALGGSASNLRVYSLPRGQGLQYFQNVDYELTYFTVNGVRANFISRSALSARLTAPVQPVIYVDTGVVIGRGVIPSPPTYDSGLVVGAGIASVIEGLLEPTYGMGTYGGGGSTYADLTGDYADTGTVVGVGHASVTSHVDSVDSGVVIGHGIASCVDIKTP